MSDKPKVNKVRRREPAPDTQQATDKPLPEGDQAQAATDSAPAASTPAPGASAPDTGAAAKQAQSSDKVDRLIIQLTPDGSAFAWDRMRDTTKEKLTALLASSPAPAKAGRADAEQLAPFVWTCLSAVGAIAACAGVPEPFHERIVKKTALTEDEVKALTPPTVAMLEKYLPATTSWGVEIGFAFAVLGVLGPKVQLIAAERSSVMAEVEQQRQQAERANKRAPERLETMPS